MQPIQLGSTYDFHRVIACNLAVTTSGDSIAKIVIGRGGHWPTQPALASKKYKTFPTVEEDTLYIQSTHKASVSFKAVENVPFP